MLAMSFRWRITITTAPREPATLTATLLSLILAGWDASLLHVCPDPGIGPWPHFLAVLQESLAHDDWDMLLACQDDIQLARGARNYCDRTLGGLPPMSLASLYTCAAVEPPANRSKGWWRIRNVLDAQGALCWAIDRPMAEFLIERPRGRGERAQIDVWVREAVFTRHLSYWTHTPSLVQHTGVVSTISPGIPWNKAYREAGDFIEEIT